MSPLPTAENLNAPNGYVFDGWRLTNDQNDNNKITVHNSKTLGNATYYARWIDVEPPTATIQATTTDSYTNAVTIDKKSDVPQYGWFFTANYVNVRLVANDSSNKPVTIYQFAEFKSTGFTSPTADDTRWKQTDVRNYMLNSYGDSIVLHFKVVDAAGNVTIVSSDIFTVLKHPSTSTTSLTFGKGSTEDIVFGLNPAQNGINYPGNTFKELRIDDTVLTQGVHYFFEKKGSGYDFITLYPSFLNTLPMGQHTVTAIYYPLNFTDESIYYEGSVLPNPVNIPLTIEKGETKVSLDVSPKNQTRPGSITLTAQLPGGATGTVTYKVKVGNSAIINTDGLVLENITPVISGAADGDVFCEPVTINVSDDNLLRVTVNGVEVELTDGRFTVEPANKAVTITATDKAGNTKSLTIAVYDGHEWDEGVVTTAPTASTTGEILFTCVHCGEARTEVLPKIAPAIVEGKENVWNPTDGGTITFKSDAAFADFIRVTVDGIELDAANYELSEGSIIVTLKEEYLETLTVGTHILGIESVSGTAFTEFTVEAARTNTVINALTTFISVLLMILITFLRSYQVLHG